jgi:methylisocitrate lyase
MLGKQVIPTEEMRAKIQAAVDVRRDDDLMIMARTDALAIEGLNSAIERMHRYIDAGADMAFVEAPRTAEDMRRITSEIAVPNMANMVPGGRSPMLPARTLEQFGFACVAHPTALTYTIAQAARNLLRTLHEDGDTTKMDELMMQFDEFNRLVGLDS